MKKVLITGGSGFIGRNIVEKWKGKYDIAAPDHKELDLLDEKAVEEYLLKTKFDIVIHSAYQKIKNGNQDNFSKMLEWNMKIFSILLKNNRNYGKMLYFGSGAEYDKKNYIPMMNEEYFGKNIPDDSYGFSKYLMSQLCNLKDNVFDLRLFGVYGKYEQWERRFISNAICRGMCGYSITIEQNAYFDYLYIDDLIAVLEWFINYNPKYRHYNVTSGRSIDLLTIAEKVRDIINVDVDVIVKNKGLKREYSASNKKLIEEAHKIEFTSLDMGIRYLYQYYQEIKPTIEAKLSIITQE